MGRGFPYQPLLLSLARHCPHPLLQDWMVAWPGPDLLEEGESTLLAGEAVRRA